MRILPAINRIFSELQNLGVNTSTKRLETDRIRIANRLAIFLIIVCLILVFVNIYHGLVTQPLTAFFGAILFSLVLYFNSKGWSKFSITYFVIISFAIVLAATLAAYEQGKFTETENMLYGFMVFGLILFDTWKKHLIYFLLFAGLIVLKLVKFQYMGLPFDLNIVLHLQNAIITGILLYLFLNAFSVSLKRSLKIVQDHENTLNSLIDNVPIFIALMDDRGKYTILNKRYEKAFGKSREAMLNVNPLTFLPMDVFRTQDQLYKRALKGERPEFLEKFILNDGSTFYASGKFIPIADASGQVKEVAVYVSNVTPLEEARNKLKEVNASKDKVFSIVAHDIRSPLAMFENMLNAGTNEIINEEEFKAFIQTLQSRFSPLKETINDLLEWARANMETISVVPTDFNPNDVIDEVISAFKELADSKEITMLSELSDSNIRMDKGHFKIVVRNIIQNAIKYSPLHGSISINFEEGDRDIRMNITDSGIGMDPEIIEKIGAKKIVKSTPGTRGEMGTGMGLNLVFELLEKNACQMEILSKPGEGTSFYISLQKA